MLILIINAYIYTRRKRSSLADVIEKVGGLQSKHDSSSNERDRNGQSKALT